VTGVDVASAYALRDYGVTGKDEFFGIVAFWYPKGNFAQSV